MKRLEFFMTVAWGLAFALLSSELLLPSWLQTLCWLVIVFGIGWFIGANSNPMKPGDAENDAKEE